jgi:hypothetical protein
LFHFFKHNQCPQDIITNRLPIARRPDAQTALLFTDEALFKGIAWPDLELSKALDLLEQNFFHSLTQPGRPSEPLGAPPLKTADSARHFGFPFLF